MQEKGVLLMDHSAQKKPGQSGAKALMNTIMQVLIFFSVFNKIFKIAIDDLTKRKLKHSPTLLISATKTLQPSLHVSTS